MSATRALATLILVTALCQSAPGAEYVQKQGPVTLRLGIEPLGDGGLRMRLSDQVPLTLTVDGDTPVEPVQLLPQTAEWDVRREPSTIESPPNAGKRWQQRFTLAPRKAGTLPLDVRPLKVAGEMISFEPMVITVTTVITRADPKELRDVLPPEPVPPPPGWPWWLPWLGLGVLVLALGAPTVVLARRWLRRPAPELSPSEEALRALAKIEEMKLPEAGEVNRYHTLLAEVVRRYAERRFNLSAARQTSTEFLTAVRTSPDLNSGQQDLLGRFLERCDLAKYAGATPSPPECRASGEMARAFIEQTIPDRQGGSSPDPS